MPSSVRIDATALTDDELSDLSEFLMTLPAVGDVSIAVIDFVSVDDDEGPLELQAAAEPLLLTVSFLSKHWSHITAGAAGAFEIVKAGVWLMEKLGKWNSKRDASYDLKPIFDQHGQIVTMVKVKKTR